MAKYLTIAEGFDDLWAGKCTITPLVECENCKYWVKQEYGVVEVSICIRGGNILEMDSEDFCSKGVKK